jgi:hypothetical protein
MVVLAGCVMSEPKRNGPVIYSGELEASNGSFTMDGEIVLNGVRADEVAFDDIVVCLYTDDERLIKKSEPMDMGRHDVSVPVSLTTKTVPKYVVYNSSDFWTKEAATSVAIRVRNDRGGGYREEYVKNSGDLPGNGCSV